MVVDAEFVRNRIISIRSAKNVSARKLSLDIGYAEDSCGQIERGKANATVDFLIALCEYFEITMSEFFNENIEQPIHLAVLRENKEFFDLLLAATPEKRAAALTVLKL